MKKCIRKRKSFIIRIFILKSEKERKIVKENMSVKEEENKRKRKAREKERAHGLSYEWKTIRPECTLLHFYAWVSGPIKEEKWFPTKGQKARNEQELVVKIITVWHFRIKNLGFARLNGCWLLQTIRI